MPDDDAIKSLLERLCSLQEQQLSKQSEALEIAVAARERLGKLTAKLEQAQKTQARKAVGYQIGAWLRTGLIVFMLGLIAIAIIVSHYLK
jgi:hypothetical protein